MRISIFGLGYVGSVSAVCLAELGHEVIGVDIIPQKVDGLRAGNAPVKEPQLDELLQKNLDTDRLHFSHNLSKAIIATDCAMITVGTPSDKNGHVNLTAVERCIESIAITLATSEKKEFIVVIRSTVPPGTTDKMRQLTERLLKGHTPKGEEICKVHFSMNPEFTREGAAVEDFLNPAITVFGIESDSVKDKLSQIYEGIESETVWTPTETAELVKYTNNAFHALKVAFANEIGRIADGYNVDGKKVMEILCADKKLNISKRYLRPGFAFGGSCLPKDLRGINAIAKTKSINVPLLDSIIPSNDLHIKHHKERITEQQPQKIGVLGIAFKAQTDDLRESPGLRLVCDLVEEGHSLKMTDANLTPTYLLGRNRRYIDTLLPDWQNYFTMDVEAIFDFADTIIVTTNEAIYKDWIAEYGQTHKVIILN